MNRHLYPLLFAPVYKPYMWGGNRIFQKYPAKPRQEGICAESWEISGHSDGHSVVVNGPQAGKRLADLVTEAGKAVVGTVYDGRGFPLLIKVLDARQRLSLQVHPDEAGAKVHGGEPKTEMWYVLDAAPKAGVFVGLIEGTDRTAFIKALNGGSAEGVLGFLPAVKGEAIFVPGGRLHAIGEGCLLLEVQQSSNTTYRVYDWGRLDDSGKPRELHTAMALSVINWHDAGAERTSPRRLSTSGKNTFWEIFKTPLFHMTKLDLAELQPMTNDGRSFHAIFVENGSVRIEGSGETVEAQSGTSCLLPAEIEEYRLTPGPAGQASVVMISLV